MNVWAKILIIFIILFLAIGGYYLYSKLGLKEQPEPNQTGPPTISVSKEVPEKVNKTSLLEIVIKTDSNLPLKVKLYENFPEGFTVIPEICSYRPAAIGNNTYLFDINEEFNKEGPTIYGLAITCYARISENVSSRVYYIYSWYEFEGKRIDLEPSSVEVI